MGPTRSRRAEKVQPVSSGLLFVAHGKLRSAVRPDRHPHVHGPAADLAVFDVFLLTGAQIRQQLKGFAAVRARSRDRLQRVHDLGDGSALLAHRKLLQRLEVVDHDVLTVDAERAGLLEPRQDPAHGLRGEAQMGRDVPARHGEIELPR